MTLFGYSLFWVFFLNLILSYGLGATSCWSQHLGHHSHTAQTSRYIPCPRPGEFLIYCILDSLGASWSLVRKSLLMKIPWNLKSFLQIPLDFKMALCVHFQALEDWFPWKIPINFSDLNHLGCKDMERSAQRLRAQRVQRSTLPLNSAGSSRRENQPQGFLFLQKNG